MRAGLPLMKNVLTQLGKKVLVPLGFLVAASATHAAIRKKLFGSETILVFSNEETDDIIKIVKFLEDASLFKKCDSKSIKNKINEQTGVFLGMLAATLDASLSGNTLASNAVVRGCDGVIRAGEAKNRAG